MPKKQNHNLKIAIKVILGLAVSAVGFYYLWLYPRYTVPILTYHNIGYVNDRLFVSPEHFESQMHYLKENRYHVISLAELVEGIQKGREFPHNTVVITFDDGYQGNYTYAYPILKKYGFPAIIFLISSAVETNEIFLTWGEIQEMRKSNISFGGHTKTHPFLSLIKNKDVLWEEIYGSKKTIEEHIGAPIDFFAYPHGDFTEEAKLLVNKAGYQAACTTNRGFDILNQKDLYELKRVSVRNRAVGFIFKGKLSGYYNLFKKRKPGS